MSSNSLVINVEGSAQSVTAMDEEQLLYLLVSIMSPPSQPTEYLPLNLCLVVDRSTSMDGHRLEMVKDATTAIIEKLGPDDKLSIVAFSDRAKVIWPSSSKLDKISLKAQVGRIRASGGTEIYQGLVAGLGQMKRLNLSDYINHLILFTDGHTYGDMGACLTIAHDAAKEGIDISAFGIGSDWNEDFLDELTGISGGETAYVTYASQVADLLYQRIKGLGVVYARNARLNTSFPDGVKLRNAFKVAPFAQPLVLRPWDLRIGYVEARTPLVILLEVAIQRQEAGNELELPISIMADIPAIRRRDIVISHTYRLPVVASSPIIDPPDSVIDAVQAWNFHEMNEKAWDDIEVGNLEKAETRLNYLTQRLREAGQTKLAQKIEVETKRLIATGHFTAEGRKTLRFGTRSLIAETAIFDGMKHGDV